LFALTAGLVAAAIVQLRRQQQLAQLRVDFVSGVSHELRTPLAQIRLFAELLRNGQLRSEAERERSFGIIDEEAQRLTYLVENVLAFARSEHGRNTVIAEPLEMDHEMQAAIDAFAPLAEHGKMGYILFQFPKWFFPSTENKDYIAWCVDILRDSILAVELRNGYWFKDQERTKETLEFLSGHGIVYTSVDEPQVDIKSSAPMLDAVTTREMAVLRLHGRKADTWDARNVPVSERFDYNYSEAELKEQIAPRVQSLAQSADEVNVMFNNVHNGYGVSNAQLLLTALRAKREGLGT
jgi:uncharacterized protein YecE (DUF72 family)